MRPYFTAHIMYGMAGRVTHLKRKCSKTHICLLPTSLVYKNFICGTLEWLSSICLATRPKNWNVSVEQGNALLTLFRDQHIYYKFLTNCQPIKDILRYHKIDCYAIHTLTTRTNRFSNILFLSVSHDQTSVETL